MQANPRLPLGDDARTLPAGYYTDRDIYRAEMDRFFRRSWVCAGRQDQVRGRGDYFLREVDEESIIIVRDLEGSVQAFYNVCRHRGTRLCSTPDGTFRSMISCPYHAWTYDLKGRLVGAPHMDGTPRFCKDDYPLYPVGVSTWDGHIFINLDGGRSPLEAQLADLPAKLRPWKMEELRLVERVVYDVKANWKLIIQNYSECLHCPIIHPALQGLSHYLSGVSDAPHPSYLGGPSDLRAGVETLSMDGKRRSDVLSGLPPEDWAKVYYYSILPNLLLSLHPDYMLSHTLWPRSPDRTEVICEWHFHPDAVANPGFDPRGAVEFWDMTNRQDWQITELSQLGLKSRVYTPGPYSDREDLLHYFDRMVSQDEDAASSGRGARE
jgi:Rieske 2Fe-2S family protein